MSLKIRSGLLIVNSCQFGVAWLVKPVLLLTLLAAFTCQVNAQDDRCGLDDRIDCERIPNVHRFRTIDSICNNLNRADKGAAKTALLRLMDPIYDDGRNMPVGANKTYNGFQKPNPRTVSSNVIAANFTPPNPYHSVMIAHWGQLLAHDFTHVREMEIDCLERETRSFDSCFNIKIPLNDIRLRPSDIFPFKRSDFCMSRRGRRQQVNVVTAYIDASTVYGSTQRVEEQVRSFDQSDGTLKINDRYTSFTGKEFLPFDTFSEFTQCINNKSSPNAVPCFLAGDIRVNEQLMLTTLHTLLVREHNRIAKKLRIFNRHWDGERIYQEARKIVGAIVQKISIKDWLPKIVGDQGIRQLGPYVYYNAFDDAGVANSFATAVMRFGHTIFPPVLERRDIDYNVVNGGDIPLRDAFFAPERILFEGGLDPLIRGAIVSSLKEIHGRALVNSELTDHLFPNFHKFPLDLAALNIQRGRDHGLPSYNDWRQFCGLEKITHWFQLRNLLRSEEIWSSLQTLYRTPENIDLWVGGIMEQPVTDSKLGPTFTCIMLNQFRRARDGDRFWYERSETFTQRQIASINQYGLSKLICNNADSITRVPPDSFVLTQAMVHCASLPDLDFFAWRENIFNPQPFPGENDLRSIRLRPISSGSQETNTSQEIFECDTPECRCRYQLGTWGSCNVRTGKRQRIDILTSIRDIRDGRLSYCPQFRSVQQQCRVEVTDAADDFSGRGLFARHRKPLPLTAFDTSQSSENVTSEFAGHKIEWIHGLRAT